MAHLLARPTQKFLVELIKPSHYDHEGFVIQWRRGFIPSNSLSTLYGLVLDSRRRQVLGPDVDIAIEAYDECNTVIPSRRIIRHMRRNHNRGVICLVGVQTNQFPRALDLARRFRAAGLAVAVGGFHVSGCVAMLPELTSELKEAIAAGVTLFAGEAEGRFDQFLQDAYRQRLRPLYNFMSDLPHLESQPLPFLPRRYIRRYAGMMGCFDAGRGCPFSCSFCTIINVQGRKSRFRTVDDVERLIRTNYAQGVRSMFITDDNLARNKNWEGILDRIIELREQHGFRISIMLQADTLNHKIPNFIAKAARAGCDRVLIGLENINPESLKEVSKGQNRITEYRRMLQAWRNAGVITYGGYILGFPADTPESIRRDVAIIQNELPVDMLHFFVLTPLPGSKDHLDLLREGARLEADLNKYDTEHAATDHPRMTAEQWESIYREVWQLYYSWPHIETLVKRAVAAGLSTRELTTTIFHYYASQAFEGIHPLQAGLFRRKRRTERRQSFPRQNVFSFYRRRLREIPGTYLPALHFLWKLERMRRQIERDPRARDYTDVATSPSIEAGDALELYRRFAPTRGVAVERQPPSPPAHRGSISSGRTGTSTG